MLQKTAFFTGYHKDDTILQNEPANTYEEAKTYSESYGKNKSVILVTNAMHMPRAVMAFARSHIEVIPAPTNYRLKGNHKHKWFGLPSLRNIENLSDALYEYAGMNQYTYLK